MSAGSRDGTGSRHARGQTLTRQLGDDIRPASPAANDDVSHWSAAALLARHRSRIVSIAAPLGMMEVEDEIAVVGGHRLAEDDAADPVPLPDADAA